MLEVAAAGHLKPVRTSLSQDILENKAFASDFPFVVKRVTEGWLIQQGSDPFSQAVRLVNIFRLKLQPKAFRGGPSQPFGFRLDRDCGKTADHQSLWVNGEWKKLGFTPKCVLEEGERTVLLYLPEDLQSDEGQQVPVETAKFMHYQPEKGPFDAPQLGLFAVCRYLNRKGKFDIRTVQGTLASLNHLPPENIPINFSIPEL